MSEQEKLALDLYAIEQEAKTRDKIRKNPKKYAVSEDEAKNIMSNLKDVTKLEDILVA